MEHGKIKRGATVANFSIDGTLSGNSDTLVPTQKAVKNYVDLAVQGLDWQESILDMVDFTTVEPVAPSVGQRYINTVTGTSNETSQSVTIHYIYEWNGSTWTEIVPTEGFATWVEAEDVLYTFNTSWVKFGSTITHENLLGLQGGVSSEHYHLTNAEHGALHPSNHTIASHNDTTATGAELETLTDGSETALHSHAGGGTSEFFSSNGTFTAPAGVTQVYVTIIGGGGGGGGGQNAAGYGGGGGGRGGYIFRRIYAVTPASNYAVVIGAAGTGGLMATDGNDGNASTFDGTIIAGGGLKGSKGAGSNGGDGGLSGDIGAEAWDDRIATTTTENGTPFIFFVNGAKAADLGGAGGSSPLGFGGVGAIGGQQSATPAGYGGGGGGHGGSGQANPGGSVGAAGCCLVEW